MQELLFLAVPTLQVADLSEVPQQSGGRARTRTCDLDIKAMEPSNSDCCWACLVGT